MAGFGRSHLVERGVLALSRAEGDWSDQTGMALAETDIALDRLEVAEIAQRFPMLDTARVRHGLWTPRGGALLADRIVTDLARWLREHGVVVRPHAPIEAADAATGTVSGPDGQFSGDVAIRRGCRPADARARARGRSDAIPLHHGLSAQCRSYGDADVLQSNIHLAGSE